MVTSSPTTVGWVPEVTCTTEWSCTFVRAPMRTQFTSPRMTVWNQTEESSPISTSPTTTLPGATSTLAAMRSIFPSYATITDIGADASPRSGGSQGGVGKSPWNVVVVVDVVVVLNLDLNLDLVLDLDLGEVEVEVEVHVHVSGR